MRHNRWKSVAIATVMAALPLLAAAARYATPQQTVRTFAAAMAGDKIAAMEACVFTRTVVQRHLMDAIFLRQAAQFRLERAARKKFGPRPAAIFDNGHGSIRSQMRQAVRSLRHARLVERGRRARLILPHAKAARHTLPPMYFRKIGPDWKIDASRAIKVKGRRATRRLALAVQFDAKLGAAINRTATDINRGRFARAKLAKQALLRRVDAIIAWYKRVSRSLQRKRRGGRASTGVGRQRGGRASPPDSSSSSTGGQASTGGRASSPDSPSSPTGVGRPRPTARRRQRGSGVPARQSVVVAVRRRGGRGPHPTLPRRGPPMLQ